MAAEDTTIAENDSAALIESDASVHVVTLPTANRVWTVYNVGDVDVSLALGNPDDAAPTPIDPSSPVTTQRVVLLPAGRTMDLPANTPTVKHRTASASGWLNFVCERGIGWGR